MPALCLRFTIGFVISSILAGCGGPDFGGDVSISADQRHVLKSDAARTETVVLKLPEQRPLNIHVKKSSQNPGVKGQAQGYSDADATGKASCTAEASQGGSASAEFNIGHRVENNTGSIQDVSIDMTYDLKQVIQATPEPAAETLASTALYLVVMDSMKRKVAEMNVLQVTSDQAISNTSTKDRRNLTVQFEPRLSYDVMLFGKVDATTSPKQEAKAQIEIKNLKLQLTFSPAKMQPKEK